MSVVAHEFLRSADFQRTPFWIMLGYDGFGNWEGKYTLKACPGLSKMQETARNYTRIAGQTEWRSWPAPYKWRFKITRPHVNQFS